MSEHVPTTEQVRLSAADKHANRVSRPAFDRWLAQRDREVIKEFLRTRYRPSVRIENPEDVRPFLAAHDREVAERAWDEGFNKGTAHGIAYQAGNDEAWKRPANPYRIESEARP